MKKPILLHSLLAAALVLLFFSCGKPFTLESSSLIAYGETGAGQDPLSLNLSRDRSVVFGSWEAASWGRYGLAEGEVKADGSLALRLYAASTAGPVGGIVGKYADAEKRIEGKISFGKENARSISLKAIPAATEGLSPGRIEATSRENLDKGVLNPTRFIYVGFEPTAPAEFVRWYRAAFQGGLSLKEAMAREKEAFIEDFNSTGAGLKAQASDIDIAPWYYEGRQLLSYRGKGLLVMGLRRQSYTGGKDSSNALRYAVIDEKESRLLGPDDFLNPGWQEGLPGLLASIAKEELGLEEAGSLMAAGLNTEKPEPSGDFFVYSQGLGFHYSPGELAPAAAGDFFLLLPFDRLGKLGKAETLSRFGLSSMPRPVLLSSPSTGEAASGSQPAPSGGAPGGGSK